MNRLGQSHHDPEVRSTEGGMAIEHTTQYSSGAMSWWQRWCAGGLAGIGIRASPALAGR